jgi:hypothetical protein
MNNWYTTDLTLSASASDAASGMDLFEYSLNNGVWTAYSTPLALGDGKHTLSFWAQDKAGLVRQLDESYQVDTRPASDRGEPERCSGRERLVHFTGDDRRLGRRPGSRVRPGGVDLRPERFTSDSLFESFDSSRWRALRPVLRAGPCRADPPAGADRQGGYDPSLPEHRYFPARLEQGHPHAYRFRRGRWQRIGEGGDHHRRRFDLADCNGTQFMEF